MLPKYKENVAADNDIGSFQFSKIIFVMTQRSILIPESDLNKGRHTCQMQVSIDETELNHGKRESQSLY